MLYEDMLIVADKLNVIVKEKPLQSSDGRIKGNKIAIRKDIDTHIKKSCVLAEELGHYYTTSGNILNQDNISNRKQEYKARLFGYDMQIGLIGLIDAFEHSCKTFNEIAEYLDVTEEYLHNAIDCYSKKYGTFTTWSNYIIYFYPNLGVMRIQERL